MIELIPPVVTVPAPITKKYSVQKRMQLKMAADKKKVMGITVGTYAYAVVEGEVKKFKIVSISESKDIMKPCYVGFRDVTTGRLDKVWIRLKNLKTTRLEAQRELVKDLYDDLSSPRWKLHCAQQVFNRKNKVYLKALAACNKLAKKKK